MADDKTPPVHTTDERGQPMHIYVIPDPQPRVAKRTEKQERVTEILAEAVTDLLTIGILSLLYGGLVLYSVWKVGRDGD